MTNPRVHFIFHVRFHLILDYWGNVFPPYTPYIPKELPMPTVLAMTSKRVACNENQATRLVLEFPDCHLLASHLLLPDCPPKPSAASA